MDWLTGQVLLKKTFQTAREARKALDGKNFSKRFLKAFFETFLEGV